MDKALAKIHEITSDPYSYVSGIKEEKNKKVIGCFPMPIPEEIIHAAGLIPVVIWRSNEPVTWGHAHVPPYNCGPVRSFIDDAVKGKLHFMDGMVFSIRQCLLVKECPLIIERHVKPELMKVMYLPPAYDNEPTKDFVATEMKDFITSIENFSGNKITDDKLKQSIEVYNEYRSLMERIYEIRRENPEILTASDTSRVIMAGMLMQKEDCNDLLKELISGMEKKSNEPKGDKIKVVLAGCLCQLVPTEVLDLIEDLGMVVVDDDLYGGSRYFANKVNLNDSPINGLVNRYLSKRPLCPTKGIWDVDWAEDVIDMAKKCDAKGVITIHVKFCPPHACYYPDFISVLKDKGMPEIFIQVEHEVVSMEGTKTRLQSFAESLGGK